ncbi:universal stress protein [Sporomusa sp. KB1]|uniref:universal stress protein n=1 Tax=Sporomusa sp. KB1 TaxID=943346 RepID=UPI001C9821C6
MLEGSPAHIILKHAQEHNCDLIIMRCRGLTGIKEFMGSVSHRAVCENFRSCC